MANAPVKDFTKYRWQLGDTTNALVAWNGLNNALTEYTREMSEFAQALEEEQQQTIVTAKALSDKAATSATASRESAQAAARARDEAQAITSEGLAGFSGNDGDVLIKTDTGIEWQKRQKTIAVECSITATGVAAFNQFYELNLKARSRHVGGNISKFVVTWWDDKKEEFEAFDGAALARRLVDVESGGAFSVSVMAVDDIDNQSYVQTIDVDVVDATIAPALITSPVDKSNYIFGAYPYPLNVTTSAFDAYEPDTHIATRVQVRDADTKAILNDLTVTEGNLTAITLDTTEYSPDVSNVEIRARHKGQAFEWGPFSQWSAVSFDGQTGAISFSKVGLNEFIFPPGVKTFSAVAVGGGGNRSTAKNTYSASNGGGGGGLGWANGLEIGADRKVIVTVGRGGGGSTTVGDYITATGGTTSTSLSTNETATGGTYTLADGVIGGGGTGGTGGRIGGGSSYAGGGGGGAAGYAGRAGSGGYGASFGNTGGNGGGGGGAGGSDQGYGPDSAAGGGGGVGLLGRGENGAGGVYNKTDIVPRRGGPGSGGMKGSTWTTDGGAFGGGGGGGSRGDGNNNGNGYQGAARIIWGEGRSYPDNAK